MTLLKQKVLKFYVLASYNIHVTLFPADLTKVPASSVIVNIDKICVSCMMLSLHNIPPQIISALLSSTRSAVTEEQISDVATDCHGYVGADLKLLCRWVKNKATTTLYSYTCIRVLFCLA